ncbi:putative sgf11 (transcriptional regulation protein) [Lyophyllum shimeji]|uniref:SAGA-associated factor 11 n=1 Tax=Lyophyllum shimeji TaxID=47721 RepID=A0A9P3PJ41_LYOSH|nr:putative sgf11 (transcriptional regulation protein) [Lyophyllum shimeji]
MLFRHDENSRCEFKAREAISNNAAHVAVSSRSEIGVNCSALLNITGGQVMPKSEREEAVAALTARIFSAMVNDLIMDATLQAHHEIARSRAVCRVCNTRCGAVHTSGSSAVASQPTVSTSRAGTPASAVDAKATNGSSGTGTNTPTSVKDGNLYLECVNCSRQIASNRYAPHLSSCMGLASARRGATRGVNNNKCKPSSEAGRSPSPSSDPEANSDESPKGKGKGKAGNKRADEAEFNLKRKRLNSPQVSPAKNPKKQKTSGSPVSRLKAGSDTSGPRNNSHYPPSNSQSKIPSKLRDSSTIGASSSSTSSRESSPAVSAATPASSSFSRSPHIANNRVKANGVGPPKRPSPPRPPPIHVPDYTIDVEGEETGSSTDTDSS